MRLTAEIIHGAYSYINPLGERELDLRGRQFTHIENMGAASSDVECIDFTDNHIQVLGNLPLRPRVATLLLARNRVSQIQPGLPSSLPNLSSLSLIENNMKELADLDPLAAFPRLTHLSLLGNPVASKEHYRAYVIWRLPPSLRFLDHQRIKKAERDEAHQLFGDSVDAPTELAQKIMGKKSSFQLAATGTDDISAAATAGVARIQLTDKERRNVQDLIRSAGTLEEITRLEKLLAEGRIPGQ